MRRGFLALFALLVVLCLTPLLALADSTAATYNFNQNAAGKPTSASTDFFDDIWDCADATKCDPLDTAEHELLHAIGFASLYTDWNDHVFNGGGKTFICPSTASCTATPNKPDTAWAQLVGNGNANDLSHMATVVFNGNNQANDIMRPDLVVGQRVSNLDVQILNGIYGFANDGGINITVNFGAFDSPNDIAVINQAVTAVTNAIGGKGNGGGDNFTWNVREVPEPASLGLLFAGLSTLLAFRRRV